MPNLVVNQNAVGSSAGLQITGNCLLIATADSVFGDNVLATIEMAETNSEGEYAPVGKHFKGPGVIFISAPKEGSQYFLRSRINRVSQTPASNITIRIVQ